MSEGVLAVIVYISLGLILLLIELFSPGFSIPGIAGILFLIFGCYQAYLKLNLSWAIFTAAVSASMVIVLFKLFTRSPIWRRLRLDTNETKDKGFTSMQDFSEFLNKSGLTLTVLRPSGIALIDGRRINVISESLFLDKDKKIKVIKVEGTKVIVKEEP